MMHRGLLFLSVMVLAFSPCALASSRMGVAGHSKKKQFRVSTGVDAHVDLALDVDGVSCEFSFRAYGEQEEWEMTLSSKDGVVTCDIERADGDVSYAQFLGFLAKLNGKAIASADVWDNEGLLLQGDEYNVDGSHAVVNIAGWNRQLRKMTITSVP
eukprot:jgi/Mesvir1/1855/Mv06954-RA.1